MTVRRPICVASFLLVAAMLFPACSSAPVDCPNGQRSVEVVKERHFQGDDLICVGGVCSTDPAFGAGASFTVTGTYFLASHDAATLFLGCTNGQLELEPKMTVGKGEGSFTLSGRIVRPGELHVSFYPAGGGEGFGSSTIRPAGR